jgi:hypothetical protein
VRSHQVSNGRATSASCHGSATRAEPSHQAGLPRWRRQSVTDAPQFGTRSSSRERPSSTTVAPAARLSAITGEPSAVVESIVGS